MLKNKVNVFDFDGTLYSGNSFHDFLCFVVKKLFFSLHWYLLSKVLFVVLLRVIRVTDHAKMKARVVQFLSTYLGEADIQLFVRTMMKNLNVAVYRELQAIQLSSAPILISTAAPFIYMRFFAELINVQYLHSSLYQEGEWLENIREKKLALIDNEFGLSRVSRLYTDHYDDLPVALVSETVFLVNASNKTKEVFRMRGINYTEF